MRFIIFAAILFGFLSSAQAQSFGMVQSPELTADTINTTIQNHTAFDIGQWAVNHFLNPESRILSFMNANISTSEDDNHFITASVSAFSDRSGCMKFAIIMSLNDDRDKSNALFFQLCEGLSGNLIFRPEQKHIGIQSA